MNRLLVVLIILVIGIAVGTYYLIPHDEKLPVINPADVESEMVDPEIFRQGYGHKIGSFAFLNQKGDTITERFVEGKVYVAEYFFTTCGSICPIMNKQMKRVNNAYFDNPEVAILSFTVDPDIDTVAQMKRYADGHDIKGDHWQFLTGDKKELYQLARQSYFVLKPAEAENLGDAGSDFIHTNNFVLVDRESRIRGYYDGTNPDEVGTLLKDIQKLLEE